MPIDTREKRAAVPGVGRPWMRGKLPSSDKDEEWRAATGWSYGGNPFLVITLGLITTSIELRNSLVLSDAVRNTIVLSIGLVNTLGITDTLRNSITVQIVLLGSVTLDDFGDEL